MRPAEHLTPQSPPRERILAAAGELFYRHGIRAVGVDAIAEAAGTNKMTLYRHFESKDLLVAEYIRTLAAAYDRMWERLREKHPGDPRAQLSAWLRGAYEAGIDENGRGCAVSNAAIEITDPEHPARKVVAETKARSRSRLAQLCTEAGFEEPQKVADELFLLAEGAYATLSSMGPNGPGARLLTIAEQILSGEPCH